MDESPKGSLDLRIEYLEEMVNRLLDRVDELEDWRIFGND